MKTNILKNKFVNFVLDFLRIIENPEFKDRIQWIKEIDRNQLPSFYQRADIVVVPSLWDNSPYTCLEAMACGVPIAASEAASIPEVVEDTALLFNPAFSFSIAEALEKIIENEALRARLLAAAAQRIKNFNWEKTAQKTLKVINYET